MFDDVVVDEEHVSHKRLFLTVLTFLVIVLFFACGKDSGEPAAYTEPDKPELVGDYVSSYIESYGKIGLRTAFDNGSDTARIIVLDQVHQLYQRRLAGITENGVVLAREDALSYMIEALRSENSVIQKRGAQYLYQDLLPQSKLDADLITPFLTSISTDAAKVLWTVFTRKELAELISDSVLQGGLDSECGAEAMSVLYVKYPKTDDVSFETLHQLLLSSNISAVRWALRKLAYEFDFTGRKPEITSIDDAMRRLNLLSSSTAFGKLHSFEKKMISVLKPKLEFLHANEKDDKPLLAVNSVEQSQKTIEEPTGLQVKEPAAPAKQARPPELEERKRETPAKLETPAKSEEPAKPESPEELETPAKPEKPAKQEEPESPESPEELAKPEAPAKPESPAKLEELAKPESPATEFIPLLEDEIKGLSEVAVEDEEETTLVVPVTETKTVALKSTELSWIHLSSERELFGIRDIEAYDWEKQVFKLKLVAAVKLLADSRVWSESEPFAVKDGVQTIYEGVLVTSHSAEPFIGPTIHLDRHVFDANAVAPPLFEIRGGYLGRYNDDEWNRTNGMTGVKNTFLNYMLKDAGVLKTIDLDKVDPIKMITTANKFGNPLALTAGVQVYLDTFIIGQKALFHVMFKKGDSFPKRAHSIELLVTLNSNDQRFGAQISVKKLPLDIIEKGYLCEFEPWKANVILKGVDPQPGSAEFSVMVILNDEKGNPLTFCEVPSMSVEILEK